jgi:CO/xanthine dehydrogenase FAD-binding subunit
VEPFTYARADDPAAAVRQAADGSRAAFLAGGTNVVDYMKLGVLTPDRLVDINHVGLDKIEVTEKAVRVGAMVRNSELAWHDAIRRSYPVLSEALLSGATAQLRNMATTGGNLLREPAARTTATPPGRATSASPAPAARRGRATTAPTRCWARATSASPRTRRTCVWGWPYSTR